MQTHTETENCQGTATGHRVKRQRITEGAAGACLDMQAVSHSFRGAKVDAVLSGQPGVCVAEGGEHLVLLATGDDNYDVVGVRAQLAQR